MEGANVYNCHPILETPLGLMNTLNPISEGPQALPDRWENGPQSMFSSRVQNRGPLHTTPPNLDLRKVNIDKNLPR